MKCDHKKSVNTMTDHEQLLSVVQPLVRRLYPGTDAFMYKGDALVAQRDWWRDACAALVKENGRIKDAFELACKVRDDDLTAARQLWHSAEAERDQWILTCESHCTVITDLQAERDALAKRIDDLEQRLAESEKERKEQTYRANDFEHKFIESDAGAAAMRRALQGLRIKERLEAGKRLREALRPLAWQWDCAEKQMAANGIVRNDGQTCVLKTNDQAITRIGFGVFRNIVTILREIDSIKD